MYSVVIYVSKGKSTVAIISTEGKIIEKPFEISPNDEGLKILFEKVKGFSKEEVRFILDATIHYHYTVLNQLLDKKYWVCVENALVIKKYCDTDLRKAKNDKKDSIKLANYLAEKWFKLREFQIQENDRLELLFLSREYSKYVSTVIRLKIQMNDLIDKTFPGIKTPQQI